MNKNNCSNCGSDDFISNPNQYDRLIFKNGSFEIMGSESINDELQLFCGDCGEEVDVDQSEKLKRVILKNAM